MQADDSQNLKFSLLKKKLFPIRLDFIFLYFLQGLVSFLYIQGYIPSSLYTEEPLEYDFFEQHSVIITFHFIAAVVAGVVFMLNFWSAKANALIAFSPTSDIYAASHVFITASIKKLNKKVSEISEIHFRAEGLEEMEDPELRKWLIRPYFDFQKKRYIWDEERGLFEKFRPSKSLIQSATIQDYIEFQARKKSSFSQFSSASLQELMGQRNEFLIPEPSFFEMYRQHIVAPMFVFQILYSFLWLFDQYWKFAFMQLGMLFMFEGTVVMQRRVNLRRIRAIKLPSRKIHVFREGGSGAAKRKNKKPGNLINGEWVSIDSSELAPGDICALNVNSRKEAKDANSTKSGSNPHNIVPCDLLLLQGSAIVNESILTGETVPLIKDGLNLTDLPMDDPISLKKGSHKRHILFGGTELIQSQPSKSGAQGEGAPSELPKPPIQNAVVCQVMRTGFQTNQGKIIRTMLFNNERVTVESKEAYFFLLILLFFALLAAGYVLNSGLTQYYEFLENGGQIASPVEDQDLGFLIIDGSAPQASVPTGKKVPSLYKIIYRCVLILTSVVPPELPIQLSLAVNSCLTDLMKQAIFCTEPFRIPLAGRIDVCCFDKTGTLTKDRLKVEGVLLSHGVKERFSGKDKKYELTPLDELEDGDVESRSAMYVLALCHSLVQGDDQKLMGDPIEVASFEGIEWQWSSATETAKNKKKGKTQEILRLIRRFAFSSDLKRMTVMAKKEGAQGGKVYRVLTKGAPEVLASRISSFGNEAISAKDYERAYKDLMRAGKRVLALAWRTLEIEDQNQSVFTIDRAEVEQDLHFVGFLVMTCPMKKDTRQELELLRAAHHKLVMITGDNVLTAAHVARSLELSRTVGQEGEDRCSPLFMSLGRKREGAFFNIEWRDYDEEVVEETRTEKEVSSLAQKYMLCCEGAVLEELVTEGLKNAGREESKGEEKGEVIPEDLKLKLSALLSHITVFARSSPEQKDFIVQRFNDKGYVTLMCGDGTNDVGSLKRASVGIALVNRPENEEKEYFERMSKANALGIPPPARNAPKRPGFWDIWEQAKKQAAQNQSRGGGFQNPFQAAMQQMNQQQQGQAAQQANNPFSALGDKMIVEQGDACIAAPFTYRFSSIKSVTDLIRQGRCTLVTTFQMYRILAISSLMTAYTMSALYLDDDKYADLQMFIMAAVQMVFYFTLAFSKPLKQLAPQKPSSSIFKGPQIVSIAGQFLVHFTSLIILVKMLEAYGEGTFDNPFLEDPNASKVEEDTRVFYDTNAELTPEQEFWALFTSSNFKPSLKNTVLFLYSIVNSTTIFLVNSTGRPFKQGLMDKKGLVYVTIALYLMAGALALEVLPGLSEWMQLVPFPDQAFALRVFGVLMFNLVGSVLVEAVVRKWEYGLIWFSA